MAGYDDLDTHFSGALQYGVKIIHLEPQQYTISVWPILKITDRTMMVIDFEAVQLKDNLAVEEQLLVFGAPVTAPAA